MEDIRQQIIQKVAHLAAICFIDPPYPTEMTFIVMGGEVAVHYCLGEDIWVKICCLPDGIELFNDRARSIDPANTHTRRYSL